MEVDKARYASGETQSEEEIAEDSHVLSFSEDTVEKKDEDFSFEMQKMEEFMKTISQEAVQLNNYLLEEKKLIADLCVSLKSVLNSLHISFDIPPQDIPLEKNARKLVLNEHGQLIIFTEKGQESAAFLADYQPEVIIAVLWDVIPILAKVITRNKRRVRSRISFFEKLKTELANVVKSLGEEKAAKDKDSSLNKEV
ncbi:hypothetical protein KEJ45_01825 [Candidatus Bathyarchaeota archaeon]|nr:hypothetical protein [Candidatus Bathyarchaeota archaeon]